MIKCGLLPLNVDNFFNFEMESCGSVISDAKILTRTYHLPISSAIYLSIFFSSVKINGQVPAYKSFFNSPLWFLYIS